MTKIQELERRLERIEKELGFDTYIPMYTPYVRGIGAVGAHAVYDEAAYKKRDRNDPYPTE